MDSEKIIQDLNRRFASPLPEFYKRRIVFWIDEDREFEDKLDEISLSGAKIVALTATNNFALKKLLNVDDPSGNYLVYVAGGFEENEDNWFLDMKLYGEEFRADLLSMWMDEMGIASSIPMRNAFKAYRKFFNAKERRSRVMQQSKTPATPGELQLAIMAVLCGQKTARPNTVIKAVLSGGLDMDTNPFYRDFVAYGIDSAFWTMVSRGTGYQDVDRSLLRLAEHILLTATTRTMLQEFLYGLVGLISTPHQAWCYDFVSDWLHSEESGAIREIASTVENELKLPGRFMQMEIRDLAGTEIFPCINEVILIKLMNEIGDHIIDVDAIVQTVEKRRTCVWYDDVQNYYEGILQVANMQVFYKEHSGGFHTVEPKKVWEEYTSGYYLMDTYYRLFHKCYGRSLTTWHAELNDRFAAVMEKVEGLYVNWFLSELGGNWADAVADDLRDYGRVLEVPQQQDFYHTKIKPSQQKVYVIISDAMRFEVASSLKEQLQRETQADVKLSSMQGIFPTITKFGMAALLPHRHLSVELKSGKTERLAVLADGQPTDAGYRDGLLKQADSRSVALKFTDIIAIKRAERQELVKGMDVVYIYHDTIDEAGHLEKSIFDACDTAIEELKTLVKIITNEFGGLRIFITSDHGFLYTHDPLGEDDKVDKTTESSQDVEIGRRYAIMRNGAKPQYLLPVRFLEGDTPYEGFAPRESIRIKMKGGGLNFVHGGISLQEMVVPLIEYRFLRNDSKEYRHNRSKYDTKPVEIAILSAGRKISNMIFSLSFYQKEAVSANREQATYQLYFTDEAGKAISDTAKIIADKTSDNGQDRTFRVSFNLKSQKYDAGQTYYLVIADDKGLPVTREEFQIDIAFSTDDFDFFG